MMYFVLGVLAPPIMLKSITPLVVECVCVTVTSRGNIMSLGFTESMGFHNQDNSFYYG